MNWADYGRRLAEAGIVADPVLPSRPAPDAPWYLQVVAAVGAWFAALLALSALFGPLHALFDAAPARALLGVALSGAAGGWMRARPAAREHAFAAQFALAVSLAGLGLIGSAIVEPMRAPAPVALSCAAVAALAAWLNPETVHRSLCTLAACVGVAVALLAWRLAPVATVLFALVAAATWLRQPDDHAAGRGPAMLTLAGASSVTLLALQAPDLLAQELHGGPFGRHLQATLLLRSTLLAGVLWAVGLVVARRLGRAPGLASAVGGFVLAALLAYVSRHTPGIVASLLVWTLGTAAGRPSVRWLALAGLAAALSFAYYSMATTLLERGLMLLATAALAAIVAAILRRVGHQAALPPASQAGGSR